MVNIIWEDKSCPTHCFQEAAAHRHVRWTDTSWWMSCGQGQELCPHLIVQSTQTLPLRPMHLERLAKVAERVTQQLEAALSESGVKWPRLAGKRSRTLME